MQVLTPVSGPPSFAGSGDCHPTLAVTRYAALLMDFLEYTPDFPRESLSRRAIDYSSTICLAIFLVIYPVTGGYMWTRLCVSYLGFWGWIPTAIVVFATVVDVYTFSLWANQSPYLR